MKDTHCIECGYTFRDPADLQDRREPGCPECHRCFDCATPECGICGPCEACGNHHSEPWCLRAEAA